MHDDPSPLAADDPPPLLATWPRLYAAILVWELLVIILIAALSIWL